MAAAYAALVSLFNNLDLILNHPRHSFSFEKKQIESLRLSVCFLIDFMETCEYHRGSKEAAEVLERRIAAAAHAADDVVESHVVDQINSGSTLGGRQTSRFLLDLQRVIENMDFVSRKAMKVMKTQSGFNEDSQPTMSISSTLLTYEKINTMVGFDDVLLQLLDLLTGEAFSRRVIIPIVGMGGSGKTELATNAFKHRLIVQHFDVCLWATVSHQYDEEKVLLQLVSDQRKSNGEIVHELGEQLHKRLWRRRYLIVLDDVWSIEAWDKIQMFLPDNGNRSRIVLTTRQWTVAHCFGPSCLKMNCLDKVASWDLFCEKTFAGLGCPPELEDIGKKIVDKCKGLPLAIIVVGGHLGKSSRMQEYWENVANNMSSVLDSQENEQFLDILSLSYSYLPIQLKPCFIYMGTFQEDQKIPVSELIQLWIAEGFIKSSSNSEEVAEDYLKDLIDRNLIVAFSEDVDGKTLSCKVHDLLREMCLKIAEKEEFYQVLDTPRGIRRERRVLLNQHHSAETFQTPISLAHTNLRSLKCEGGQLPFDMRLLRVQNRISRASTNEVEGGFLETDLHHVNLRYLHCSKDDDFERNRSFHLPSSISRLWNLQTLIIKGVYQSVIAPHEIWEMTQLKHLEFSEIFLPDPHPCHSFNQALCLQNALTLANFTFSEEVCKRIPNIKQLWVEYNDPKSRCCPHNLGCLHKLEYLDISFSRGREWRSFALSLTFPTSLKKLYLTDPHLHWEELTMMVGSLPLLQDLNLYEVKAGPEWNPIEGGFPNLQSLTISDCPNLICWNVDSTHFPVLQDLDLKELSKLDNFPSSFGDIPTLQNIILTACSVSLAMSAMRMVVEQEVENGNDDIRLIVDFADDREELETFENKLEEEGLTSDNVLFL